MGILQIFTEQYLHMKKLPAFSAIRLALVCGLFMCIQPVQLHAQAQGPLRIAVAKITHDHVNWLLSRKKTDIVLVGIYEPDKDLATRYAKKFGFSMDLVYSDLGKMLDAVKPEIAVAFGSIVEHLSLVEACAPRHIDVMVEKPLATSLKQALRMDELVKQFHIKLLTNFETSWYPTTIKTYQLVNDSNYMGKIRKVVIHDGHEGPREIGVTDDFFNWLTDPEKNGGGALMDFGCYGANLMTYLMKGATPLSVTAVTQHFKPGIYPKVEDEATIIVTYPEAQCIIQASWNWPFSRKDMEVYGETGYAISVNSNLMRLRTKPETEEHLRKISETEVPVYTDPFGYLVAVYRQHLTVPDNGLYALPTNITAIRILDAARESALTGKTIFFNKK
jgi:predicted dehydrogenase